MRRGRSRPPGAWWSGRDPNPRPSAWCALEIARLQEEEDGLVAVVVGWPRHLDGSPNEQTPIVEAFARAIESAAGLPVILQDERLSSVEAESRLAHGDRNWRTRKPRLDAAAAAVVLQDYLDTRPRA